jgi:hypothetical protein
MEMVYAEMENVIVILDIKVIIIITICFLYESINNSSFGFILNNIFNL